MRSATRNEQIAGEVRAEMGRQRITMGALSKSVNISYATLSRRLSGHSPFTLDELYRIAAHLQVPVQNLIPEAVA